MIALRSRPPGPRRRNPQRLQRLAAAAHAATRFARRGTIFLCVRLKETLTMTRHRGRGIASINYPIGMNLGGDPSQALVHSNPSGKFTVSLSSIDLGQGMKSVTRQICAETLGVPVEDVYVDTADSDTGPHCMGSFASRGTHRVGNAVMAAAKEARGVMMEAAAEELEVNAADLETDGRGNIHVKGAPHRSISTKDVAIAAQFKQGKTISGRGIFLVPLSAVDPETGEMSPATCYAHACLVAEVEVDDETGEVAMVRMDSAYELGRALNPRLVEQQLVGGAWMGISHALFETTEPYYPDPEPRPARLCRISDAGSRRHLPARYRGAGASGGGWSVRRQGPGRDVRQSGIAGGRQRDFQRGRRARRRSADHAGESAARDQGAGRRTAAGASLMAVRGNIGGIDSPQALENALRAAYYLADDGIATAAYLALALGKPLLLEGAPGVGKTEAAKAIAAVLGRRLIRLQCYEGIDASAALYEWNYPRQMLAIRQAGDQTIDIYGESFLIERPMLASLRAPDSTVLLIDEIDRSDQEFEAFLLEFLSDFQISIPERGTIRAAERPVVVLTSNRTRDLHEALRRRCVYHWIDYPTAEREARIVMMRASSVAEATARAVVAAVGKLRREPLSKAPGVAEAVDWAEAATLLNKGGARWPDAFKRSIGVALKDEEDLAFISGRLDAHHRGGGRVIEEPQLPRAAHAFISFVALLRANGFAVAPEQTTAFLAAIELLGPRSPEDIRQAGLATLAPPPERRAAYDMLFRIHFLGGEEIPGAEGEDEDVVRLQDEGSGEDEPPLADEANESGEMAVRAEALVERRFGSGGAERGVAPAGARSPDAPAAAARASADAGAARALGGPAANLARIRAQ